MITIRLTKEQAKLFKAKEDTVRRWEQLANVAKGQMNEMLLVAVASRINPKRIYDRQVTFNEDKITIAPLPKTENNNDGHSSNPVDNIGSEPLGDNSNFTDKQESKQKVRRTKPKARRTQRRVKGK